MRPILVDSMISAGREKLCPVRIAGFSLMLTLLQGCAGVFSEYDSSWPEQLARLQSLSSWDLTGKLAVSDANASDSGQLRWQQNGLASRITISGPFGVAATEIVNDGNTVMVSRDDTRYTYDANKVDSQRGWLLPVNALGYWVKGMPDPRLAVEKKSTEAGELRELKQDGWQISYQAYGDFGEQHLPTRLEISKADIRAKVVVRNWRPKTVGDG